MGRDDTRGRLAALLARLAPLLVGAGLLVSATLATLCLQPHKGTVPSAIGARDIWACPVTTTGPPASGVQHPAGASMGAPCAGSGSGMTSTASSMAGEPKAGAIYLTLVNAGAADTLTGASIEAAGALELHVTEVRGGVAMMRPVLSIAVPARGEVELQPGADHLMLLNVRRELRPGDTFQLVLTFVKAGRVEVTAQVRGRQAASTGH